jgi:DNA-binding IclR family transcriptional regulator
MNQPKGNQSIERAAAILRALAEGQGGGLRLTEVATAAKLSRSSAHRLLAALVQVGLVEQDADTGLFHLGFDLFVFGTKAANRHGLIEMAQGALQRLAERTSDTVFLSVRSGTESICLDRREGSFPIRTLTLSVGDRRPLGVGAGSLALLAFLPDAKIDAIIAANAKRLEPYVAFDPASLHELVRMTRRQGYAFNDGRIVPGMCAIGVPIMGPQEEPVGALSVAAIAARMQPDRRENIAASLWAEARTLTEQLRQLAEGLGAGGLRHLLGARRG